jgi:hypothetical protein
MNPFNRSDDTLRCERCAKTWNWAGERLGATELSRGGKRHRLARRLRELTGALDRRTPGAEHAAEAVIACHGGTGVVDSL